ncbi:MAG: hypothetical protein GY904_05600 [Planctomycetaceae bacterium]|nr:hypothetical protein [Planctomycetaceae bacterium]
MSDSPNPYLPPSTPSSEAGMEWMANQPVALSNTALGLSLVYYGIVLFLFSLILGMLAGFFLPVVALLALPGILIGPILMFVGPLFCLTVPAQTNAKGLIIATVVLQLANYVAIFLPMFGFDFGEFQPFMQTLNLLSNICFLLFMRKLAMFIGRNDLAGRASRILIGGIVVFVGIIATAIFTIFTMTMLYPSMIMMALMALLAIGAIVLFVMYANLLNALSKALKNAKTPS